MEIGEDPCWIIIEVNPRRERLVRVSRERRVSTSWGKRVDPTVTKILPEALFGGSEDMVVIAGADRLVVDFLDGQQVRVKTTFI